MERVHRMEILDVIIRLLFIAVLIIASAQDILNQSIYAINIYIITILAVVKFAVNIVLHNNDYSLIVLNILFGLVMIIAESKGIKMIGGADIILICMLSIFFEKENYLLVLGLSFIGVFIVAVVLLLIGRIHKEETLPFIPFIALGTTVVTFMNMLSG